MEAHRIRAGQWREEGHLSCVVRDGCTRQDGGRGQGETVSLLTQRDYEIPCWVHESGPHSVWIPRGCGVSGGDGAQGQRRKAGVACGL